MHKSSLTVVFLASLAFRERKRKLAQPTIHLPPGVP
jgi:hypothetical protein